jgi:hypothetical protein
MVPTVEVSWLEDPTAAPEFIRSSSSPGREFLLRRNLHATTARPPSMIAPPTPTTTPIMMFLWAVLKPELPDPPVSARPGVLVWVATAVSVGGKVIVCSTGVPLMVMVVAVMLNEDGLVVVLSAVVLVVVGEVDEVLIVPLSEEVAVSESAVEVLSTVIVVEVGDEVGLVGVAVLDVLDAAVVEIGSVVANEPTETTGSCRLTFSSAPTTAVARTKAETKNERVDEHRILSTGRSESGTARYGLGYDSELRGTKKDVGKGKGVRGDLTCNE